VSMRFPTILDAFNSAARFNNQITGHYSAELREQNDQEARVREIKIQANIDDYKRDHPYVGGANEDEDKQKFSEYFGDLKRHISEQYAEQFGTGKTKTTYHDQLIGKSLAMAQNHTLVEADKWRINREQLNLGNDIEKQLESVKTGSITPRQAMENVNTFISSAGTKIELNPQQRYEMHEKASIETLKNFYTGRLDKFNYVTATPAQVTKFLDDVKNEAKKEFAFMDTEEGSWNFKGKAELEEALIQGKCFEVYKEQQAFFDRMTVSGDFNNAIAFGKLWGAEWNKHYGSKNKEFSNLNDKMRDAGSHFFNWKNLEGHLKQGRSGKDMYNIDFHWRDVFGAAIDGNEFILNGQRRRFDTIEDGVHQALLIAEKAFMYGREDDYPLAREEWQKAKAQKMENFYDELEGYLKDKNPDLQKTWNKFRKAETYLDKKGDYYHSDFENDRGQSAISFFTNLLFRQGITDTKTIEEEMKNFTGKRLIENATKDKTVSSPAKRVIRDAELTRFLESEAADDIMHSIVNLEKDGTRGDGRSRSVAYRNENQGKVINELAERQRVSAAKMRGEELDDLVLEWQGATTRKNDVQPRAMFRSKSTGELFKIDYEGGKNNDEKEVLMKYNTTSKKWSKVPEKEQQRDKTQGEKNKAAIEKVQDNKERIQNISKSLADFKHPETGEYLDFRNTPPPNYKGKKDDWDPKVKQNYKMTDYQKIMAWTNYLLNKENGK